MKFEPFKFEPPSEYKTLDDLLRQAAHYADWSLRNRGEMSPAFFVLSLDGPPAFFIYGRDFGDEASKDDLRDTARIFAVAHAATHSVICVETWVLQTKKNERKKHPLPSESVDRQEMIVYSGEQMNAPTIVRMDTIVRQGNGKYFGLAPFDNGETSEVNGRFSHLLPKKFAPVELRELGKALFALKGFQVAGTAPRGGKHA